MKGSIILPLQSKGEWFQTSVWLFSLPSVFSHCYVHASSDYPSAAPRLDKVPCGIAWPGSVQLSAANTWHACPSLQCNPNRKFNDISRRSSQNKVISNRFISDREHCFIGARSGRMIYVAPLPTPINTCKRNHRRLIIPSSWYRWR